MNKLIVSVVLLAASNLAYAEKSECRVNINSANAADIQACLIGFGEKKAQVVVDVRDKEPFRDLQDFVTRVSGVGEKTVENNRNRICFDDQCVSGEAAKQPGNTEKLDKATEGKEAGSSKTQ